MIPLVDLHAQYERIGPDIEAAVTRVLRSGRYALGPEVEAFEHEFASYCGVTHAVGVNSGTSALVVALTASGVGQGDEVITVPFSFLATASTITQVGARVRFVDIDERSLTMDANALEGAITDRTKAIVPVHLYGQPADLNPILAVAHRHGLVVIEDAAQAVGARYHDRRVGGIADIGCFSFYPSKNLSAAGEGGMLVTHDGDTARVAALLRDWGQVEQPDGVICGSNYRLDGIQAAVLRVKLEHLDEWNDARRVIAQRYSAGLRQSVETPRVMPYAEHAFHVYAIRSPRRDRIRHALTAAGVASAIHYPAPIHLQPAFARLGYGPGSFPVSEAAAHQVLSLPMFPELSTAQQDTVIDAVCQSLDSPQSS